MYRELEFSLFLVFSCLCTCVCVVVVVGGGGGAWCQDLSQEYSTEMAPHLVGLVGRAAVAAASRAGISDCIELLVDAPEQVWDRSQHLVPFLHHLLVLSLLHPAPRKPASDPTLDPQDAAETEHRGRGIRESRGWQWLGVLDAHDDRAQVQTRVRVRAQLGVSWNHLLSSARESSSEMRTIITSFS